MAREQFQSLTEQMYYILLALLEPRCGVDISQKAMEISRGRMQIGPGTLYTLLAKFEKEDMIKEAGVEGRRKYYQITGWPCSGRNTGVWKHWWKKAGNI